MCLVFLGACAPLQTSARAGKRTPPPMHQVGCLGWTSEDTSKEAKLHGRQCPLSCVFRFKFPRLSPDASQARFGLHSPSPSPRGKSGAPLRFPNSRILVRPIFYCLHSSRNATNYSKTAALESSAAAICKNSEGPKFLEEPRLKTNNLNPVYTFTTDSPYAMTLSSCEISNIPSLRA